MAFAINFVGDEFEDEGVRLHQVVLTIGDYSERMCADVTRWSMAQYEHQWARELQHVIDGRARGALITSVHNPQIGNRVEAWPMWREENLVFFQNQLVGMIELEPNFDPNALAEFIGERREVSEEGAEISQWEISVTEVRAFLDRGVNA